MAKRSGSRKGTPFEREVCRRLSLWWTQDEDPPNDFVFWRANTSGALATTRRKKGKSTEGHCGDVCAVHPSGKPLTDLCVIELKKGFHGNATIHDLLDRPSRFKAKETSYAGWIAKAERTAEREGVPYWMLIHMRDQKEPLVFVPGGLWARLVTEVDADGPLVCLWFDTTDNVGLNVTGLRLDHFLEVVGPDVVIDVARSLGQRKRA